MKKGLELSMTVIVLLIISVVMFILAISMFTDWFGKAKELKTEIDTQTEQQIMAALRQGNNLVTIPYTTRNVKKGEGANFGIGVRNPGAPEDFTIVLGFSGAYLPDGTKYDGADENYVEENWLGGFYKVDSFNLGRNEQKAMPLLIKAANNVAQGLTTPKGDYVFNVCVFDDPSKDRCDLNMLQDAYTNRIYQVTVRVV